ncbi:hypothetical protein CDAR_281831 [Caerostris darwini]|uniref:Uncharacterized protein n=1 Tax=Caerostris darwini TaxID=1538125 RepID=A0AAV4WSY9_9ARAC|nr:hypothetical protein CDAR_281831 [Caerostris darwini]
MKSIESHFGSEWYLARPSIQGHNTLDRGVLTGSTKHSSFRALLNQGTDKPRKQYGRRIRLRLHPLSVDDYRSLAAFTISGNQIGLNL